MTLNPHLIDAEQLRQFSGKGTAASVRRWANRHGIKVLESEDGPCTTVEAVNKALGVGSANDPLYKADDIA